MKKKKITWNVPNYKLKIYLNNYVKLLKNHWKSVIMTRNNISKMNLICKNKSEMRTSKKEIKEYKLKMIINVEPKHYHIIILVCQLFKVMIMKVKLVIKNNQN